MGVVVGEVSYVVLLLLLICLGFFCNAKMLRLNVVLAYSRQSTNQRGYSFAFNLFCMDFVGARDQIVHEQHRKKQRERPLAERVVVKLSLAVYVINLYLNKRIKKQECLEVVDL